MQGAYGYRFEGIAGLDWLLRDGVDDWPELKLSYEEGDAMLEPARVLGDEILSRSTKAHFDEVAWGPRSRAFASEWDGDIGDPSIDDLIDPEALRRNWSADRPDFRSAILLQAARLARD